VTKPYHPVGITNSASKFEGNICCMVHPNWLEHEIFSFAPVLAGRSVYPCMQYDHTHFPYASCAMSHWCCTFIAFASRESSVGIAARLLAGQPRNRVSILDKDLGSAWPLNQWVPGVVSLGITRHGREAGLSPSSAEVKNGGAIHPLPRTFTWRNV
jgi:hypothetical protein